MSRTNNLIIALAFSIIATSPALSFAAVITTLDFIDGNWTPAYTASGGTNNGSVTSSTISISKSGAAGGVRVTVDLTGSISTLGYENITLQFDGLTTDTLEWDGNLANSVNSTDGLGITGSGITINANSLNDLTGTTAETEFTNGTTFPTANFGGGINTDFTFDPSVDNSSITSLSFILQINAAAETLTLSNVRILGDIIPPAPEPGTALIMIFGAVSLVYRSRTQRRTA